MVLIDDNQTQTILYKVCLAVICTAVKVKLSILMYQHVQLALVNLGLVHCTI